MIWSISRTFCFNGWFKISWNSGSPVSHHTHIVIVSTVLCASNQQSSMLMKHPKVNDAIKFSEQFQIQVISIHWFNWADSKSHLSEHYNSDPFSRSTKHVLSRTPGPNDLLNNAPLNVVYRKSWNHVPTFPLMLAFLKNKYFDQNVWHHWGSTWLHDLR